MLYRFKILTPHFRDAFINPSSRVANSEPSLIARSRYAESYADNPCCLPTDKISLKAPSHDY